MVYAQVYMPFVDVRMMIGALNDMQEKATEDLEKKKNPKTQSIDELKQELINKHKF